MAAYDEKIKAEALTRLQLGEAKAKIARDLGLSPKTVAAWARAAGLITPAASDPRRDPKRGAWIKGVSGNPSGLSSDLVRARHLAHRNAPEALRRLQAHADRLEGWLDEEREPSMGQSMTASELTRIYAKLAAPALTPEKSTVEVQHSGEVAHAHRITIEGPALGSALDLLQQLGALPPAPEPAAVDPAPPAPPAAGPAAGSSG